MTSSVRPRPCSPAFHRQDAARYRRPRRRGGAGIGALLEGGQALKVLRSVRGTAG